MGIIPTSIVYNIYLSFELKRHSSKVVRSEKLLNYNHFLKILTSQVERLTSFFPFENKSDRSQEKYVLHISLLILQIFREQFSDF
jgi:hypothetical protein